MKVIVVGAGGVARELIKRLSDAWEVTLVDVSAEAIDQLTTTRRREVVVGDGSSRLVLERAGLSNADAVVAATSDEDMNLEICRLARAADVSRVVAVAHETERLPMYHALGVAAVSPDGLAARRLELSLETRRVSSMPFAGGKAEAIEFRVAYDSPVRGRKLSELRAHSYIVGAILRHDELIIPHGATTLEADDLVTVVGVGADFGDIVRTFTSGEGRFPLDFGKRIAVALDGPSDLEGAVLEAADMVRNTRATALLIVHRDPAALRDATRGSATQKLLDDVAKRAEGVELSPRGVRGSPATEMLKLAAAESVGMLVIPAPTRGFFARRRAVRRATKILRTLRRPVLLARGTQPYRRILAPARETPAGRAAARAAIDLARFFRAELVALAVTDPVFLAGPAAPKEARDALDWLEEEAAVHAVRVHGTIVRGNPVRAIVAAAGGADLLVLGADVVGPRDWNQVDIAPLIAHRTDRSVLLIPAGGDATPELTPTDGDAS